MAGYDNIKDKGFNHRPENINKKGQPRKLPDLDTVVANVLGADYGKGDNKRTKADALIEALFKQAHKGNTRAAEILLDRGYGKPKQEMEQKTVIFSVDVTDEEAKQIAMAILSDI